MSKQKVVIIRSTGIKEDSRTTKLAKELAKLGYDITILGWDRKNQHKSVEKWEVNNNLIELRYFKKESKYGSGIKNIFKMLSFQKWIKKQVKNFPKGTIIHACDFDTAKPIYKLCKNNYKLIYDIFDFYSDAHYLPLGLNKIINKQEINVINNADCTIICTEQRVEQIKGSNPKKLVVIHNTPDLNIELSPNVINQKLKVCFIGALTPDRLLMELVNEIPKHPEYEFVFGGLGYYENEIKEASSKCSNLKYLGQLNYSDVLECEKDCDILFATYNPEIKNHQYSAPNKFYEAGCLSKPVIVCKDTGIDKLVEEYNTGLCINYSAEDFFDKLDMLNRDRELLKTLGQNGHKAYLEHFSWQVMAERIKILYESI